MLIDYCIPTCTCTHTKLSKTSFFFETILNLKRHSFWDGGSCLDPLLKWIDENDTIYYLSPVLAGGIEPVEQWSGFSLKPRNLGFESGYIIQRGPTNLPLPPTLQWVSLRLCSHLCFCRFFRLRRRLGERRHPSPRFRRRRAPTTTRYVRPFFLLPAVRNRTPPSANVSYLYSDPIRSDHKYICFTCVCLIHRSVGFGSSDRRRGHGFWRYRPQRY
jgi:hypothetical protein